MKTYCIISKVYRFANIGYELPRVTHLTSHHNSLLETILVILLQTKDERSKYTTQKKINILSSFIYTFFFHIREIIILE